MTDLVQYNGDQRSVAVAATNPPPTGAAASLVSWAQEADAAYLLAERLVATSFCPIQYRGKPAEAAAAMLAGSELGLSPMAALKAFDVIQGIAAPRAITLRAIAQSKGAQFVTEVESPTRVVMRARRNGGEWERAEWTIERAAQLGLTGKAEWKKQPQTMLIARATSDLARRVAADAILGIPYSAEEVRDSDVTIPGELAAPAPPRVTSAEITGRRATTVNEAAAEEPTYQEPPTETADDEVPEPEEEGGTEGPPISAAQSRLLHALLGKLELTDRELALAKCSDVLGREVETTKTLTKAEAGRLIEALAAELGDGA